MEWYLRASIRVAGYFSREVILLGNQSITNPRSSDPSLNVQERRMAKICSSNADHLRSISAIAYRSSTLWTSQLVRDIVSSVGIMDWRANYSVGGRSPG